ncbi:MAG TPA: type II toxin-antitoxin system RelE/ParE family toxin [Nevskiaceae bacterium]|nr:type II toxin-antitoxin system RelE/ParE family toxin [Nevskiaceae bacterium]
MRELEWTEAARADLLAIIDYIADDNPDAAQHLKEDIESKVEGLRDFPDRFRNGRVPGTREMVARANYIVIYAVEPCRVRILRVLHAAWQWPPAPRQPD